MARKESEAQREAAMRNLKKARGAKRHGHKRGGHREKKGRY